MRPGRDGCPLPKRAAGAALECFGRGHPSLSCLAQRRRSGCLRIAHGGSWLWWGRRRCPGCDRYRLRGGSPLRWGEARACESRRSSGGPQGSSCLPRRRSESRQAQSGHPRRQCAPSHGGLDHGCLPGSFRPCVSSLHPSDPGNRRGPVDLRKLRQRHHGSPAQAHRSFGLRLPAPSFARRTTRVVERAGRPLPKHSRAAPAARFGRGRPALSPPRADLPAPRPAQGA